MPRLWPSIVAVLALTRLYEQAHKPQSYASDRLGRATSVAKNGIMLEKFPNKGWGGV